MAGRSPALKARRAVQQRNAMSPQLSTAPGTNDKTASPLSQANVNGGVRTSATPTQARKNSLRNGRLTAAPPAIPDADGFVPLSSMRNRNSFYDNVTPIGSTKHSREPSTNTTSSRVHSTPNNVTYVDVGDDSKPESPTPDYDDREVSSFEAALRNQYAMAAQSSSGQYRQR